MKLTIANTDRIVRIDGIRCRIWEGTSEGGIPVIAFVATVAVHQSHDRMAFERELLECPPLRASAEAESFPLRMVT